MTILHLKCRSCGIGLKLPAAPAEAGLVLSRLREGAERNAPVRIDGASGPVPGLAEHLGTVDLDSRDDLEKLNALAARIDAMSAGEQQTFAGALALEGTESLDAALRVAGGLDGYELFPNIRTDEELGRFLVETGPINGKFAVSEDVLPYLDYAKLGAARREALGGAFSAQGFVRRREAAQTQEAADRPAFALTLASPSGACRLELPASEDALERARRTLALESLDSAAIEDVEIGYPWAHLLPTDHVTLEDASALAELVLDMTPQGLRVFGAALEVEEPRSFREAAAIAEEVYDYELVAGSESEYAREALRYAGAGDEILEMLDGFTDFEALGRFEMEQDGVRETSYGPIKRLSAPFPQPEHEMGQTMC